MNKEKVEGDLRFREGFHARAENGQGSWSMPPTNIRPGVSRMTSGGRAREDLMPGTSTSGRGLNTSRYNPVNAMSFNTVAPMIQRSKEPINGRPPKRPRLGEPSEQMNNGVKYSHQHTPVPSNPIHGPSTLRQTFGQPDQALNGDDSDDPIDSFRPEQQRSSRSGVKTASILHRHGTPSGTTLFPSIFSKREKYEKALHISEGLPYMTMSKAAPPTKKSRILTMKGQDGRDRSSRISEKPRQRSPSITFMGDNDPLSQPSLSPKRHKRTEKEVISSNMNKTRLRRPIEAMFFGTKPHNDLTDAYLFFDEGGLRLTLQLGGKEMHISHQDIMWKKTDNLSFLFICVKSPSKIHRELQQFGLWMPKTLEQDYPFRTISLKFSPSALNDDRIGGLLDAMAGTQDPPKELVSASQAWHRLESMGQGTNMRVFDDSSDLTSPSPEQDSSFARSARVPPPRTPAKRPTRASGVKKVDIDNDEVILVYPFSGPGSTQITRGEQQRLQPNEFLNDTLIEFGLKYWLETLSQTNAQLAKKIHVFSPFFYKKLKHKDSLTGYNAVRKWTKVDIFQKSFLVVPINERVHWYLAIILFPGNILSAAKPIDKTPAPEISIPEVNRQQEGNGLASNEVVPETPEFSRPSSRAVSPLMLVGEDTEMKDASTPDAVNLFDVHSEEKPYRTEPSSPDNLEEELLNVQDEEDPSPDEGWKQCLDTTWILSFDSLGGRHPAALRALRDYLMHEAKHKKGVEIQSPTVINSKMVPSPAQPNHCDCGVYLIQTAETFLKQPLEFMRRLMDKNDTLTEHHPLWNLEEFAGKRGKMHNAISQLSEAWRNKQLEEAKKVPTGAVTQHQSKPLESPFRKETLVFVDDSGDEIEIVGEASAPKGKPTRLAPMRRAKRFS